LEAVNEEAIRGEYRLKFLDQMHWAFSRPKKIAWVLVISIIVFATTMLVIDFSDGAISNLRLFYFVAAFAVFDLTILFLTLAATNAIFFARLADAQKNLVWEIDWARLTLTDGAGSSVQIPWSQIRFIDRRRSGVILAFIPMGHRWIATRAFSDDAWTKIMGWAKENGVSIR